MGELYNPYPKLPRNIKQIGEKDDTARLYMEDYVSTYLRGLNPSGEDGLRVGILLGNEEERDGVPYLFLDGAMELQGISASIGDVRFTEEIWENAKRDMEQMFPKRTIQGWFLCGARGCQLKSVDYWTVHGKYFSGRNKLMYLNSGEEGEEEIYIAREEGLGGLKGYCIYYERNPMMQDYMVLQNGNRRVDAGVHDQVTRNFKNRMAEKKGQFQSQRSTIKMLGGACGVLSAALLAGGIVMFDNFSKMQRMESVIASVLPEGMSFDEPESMEEIEIQMAAGGVYPTKEQSTGADGASISGVNGASTSGADSTSTSETDGVAIPESVEETQSGISEKEHQVSGGQAVQERSPEESSAAQDSSEEASAQNTAESAGQTESEKSEVQKETMVQEDPSKISGGNKAAAEADSGIVETLDVASGKTVRYYVVGQGETLNAICYKVYHSLSAINEICELNGLESENKIMAGQKLQLP